MDFIIFLCSILPCLKPEVTKIYALDEENNTAAIAKAKYAYICHEELMGSSHQC